MEREHCFLVKIQLCELITIMIDTCEEDSLIVPPLKYRRLSEFS